MKFFFKFVEKVKKTDGEGLVENYRFIRGIFPWRSKKKRKYSNVVGFGEECTSIFMENDGQLAIAATYKEKSMERHNDSNTGWKLRHISFRVFILAICILILGLGICDMNHDDEFHSSRDGLRQDGTRCNRKNNVQSIQRDDHNVRVIINYDWASTDGKPPLGFWINESSRNISQERKENSKLLEVWSKKARNNVASVLNTK
jgi:hypothetical protein